MNKVTLYKRPNSQLELTVNGLVVKNNFATEFYDSTTKSQINDVLRTTDGTNRLSGTYSDSTTGTIFYTYDSNSAFDGTRQINITFIDQS